MMKLSLMNSFFDTVDETNGQSTIAAELAAKWGIKEVEVTHWRSSANFVFKVAAQNQHYFLRFNHASERDVRSIEAEMEAINILASAGLRVARPVRSLTGHYVENVSTLLGIFYGVLFEALPGDHWELNELDDERFERWGKALGMAHIAGQGFTTSARPAWSDHIQFARQWIPKADQAALSELKYIEHLLASQIIDLRHYGLIHFDFELDNLLWSEKEAGILDWDDCALYWYEADIAFALRDLFDDQINRIDFENDRLQAFLRGYRSARPIDDEAIRRLPLFLRLYNLITLARLIRAIAEEPRAGERSWADQLRTKIRRAIEQRRTDILANPLQGFFVIPHSQKSNSG